MEAEFWIRRWADREIDFHRDIANVQLTSHVAKLNLEPASRVFVPLCGKTLDIAWLLAEGYRVCGAELSQQAVGELFAELGVEPECEAQGNLSRYTAGNLTVFQGDIFELTPEMLGEVDAVYDRAALIALPREMRDAYAVHLRSLTNTAPQLINLVEYRQEQLSGPPFSIDDSELMAHYGDSYELRLLFSQFQLLGLKGEADCTEKTWLLRPR